MTDVLPPVPDHTVSAQRVAVAQGKFGFGKIVIGGLSALATSYLINQASLHGVNFQLNIGNGDISSEVVKSSIEGAIESVIIGCTPNHFLAWTIDVIRWFKGAKKQISDAYNQP